MVLSSKYTAEDIQKAMDLVLDIQLDLSNGKITYTPQVSHLNSVQYASEKLCSAWCVLQGVLTARKGDKDTITQS